MKNEASWISKEESGAHPTIKQMKLVIEMEKCE